MLATTSASSSAIPIDGTPGTDEMVASDPVGLPATTLCERTQQVRDFLVSRISGVDGCVPVTPEQLTAFNADITLGNAGLESLTSGDFAELGSVRNLTIDGPELGVGESSLTTLPANVFAGLSGLEQLTIRNTTLATIASSAFAGLTNLQSLLLSGNSLTSIAAGAFTGLTSLQSLLLSDNSLTNAGLPNDVFDPLAGTLTSLELQDNELATFPTVALHGLTKLATFNIDGNSGADFMIPYELVRTSAGEDSPATIEVRLPPYVPASLRALDVNLSALYGTLALGAGTPATSVPVALDTPVTVTSTEEGLVVIVSAPAPTSQTAVNGMEISAAEDLRAVEGNTPADGVPTITGSPVVKQELTAGITGISDHEGLPSTDDFSYLWQRSSTTGFDDPANIETIDSATSKVYTLQEADIGQYVRVLVSFTDTGPTPSVETLTSIPTRIAETDLCIRTANVQNVILNRIGEGDCVTATTEQLAAIEGLLDLSNHNLTSLMPGDFAGLSGITSLSLGDGNSSSNKLTTLPAGVFVGLDSVTTLTIRSISTLTTLESDSTADLTSFSGLTSLTTLRLDNNAIENSAEQPVAQRCL